MIFETQQLLNANFSRLSSANIFFVPASYWWSRSLNQGADASIILVNWRATQSFVKRGFIIYYKHFLWGSSILSKRKLKSKLWKQTEFVIIFEN